MIKYPSDNQSLNFMSQKLTTTQALKANGIEMFSQNTGNINEQFLKYKDKIIRRPMLKSIYTTVKKEFNIDCEHLLKIEQGI